MPKKNQNSGIVIINGTAYDAKTGQPAHKEESSHENKNRSIQAQRMTDISHLQQPEAPKSTNKAVQNNQKNQKQGNVEKERPPAARAQQLHTIKKGSKEQVLDLRKTARAQKLKGDRKNEIAIDEASKEAERSRPLAQPGVGPKLSQLDTKARLSRARKYQKSESIQKFFPESQPSARNQSDKVAVNQKRSQVLDNAPAKNEINHNKPTETEKSEDSKQSAVVQPQKNLSDIAKTRELEKMVQKHPRHVPRTSTGESLNVNEEPEQSRDQQNPPKQTFWSRLKIKPRITSYATATVAALVLVGFVAYLNMPQMALQVAANRAGFEASMPAYRPSGFSFNGPVSYAPGQIVISFGSHSDDRSFEIVQRKTTWDSTSLLENYVAQESENYVPVQQNGLTIYLFDDNGAAWVDGGVWYTIQGDSDLNSDQLLKVAASL